MPKGTKVMKSNTLIDPAHEAFDFFQGQMTLDVWEAKYKYGDEINFQGSIIRILNGVYAQDTSISGIAAKEEMHTLMNAGLWMPAGRIMAGAGTDKIVTLLNCYVNGKITDSMHSIMDHVSYAALTMQQGGGIGTDFSTIRPSGAQLKRTGKGSRASGPLPFMDMWNEMGKTVESAGARRGAQMGTLCDTHPDLPAFIRAKQTAGRLTQFNVSILVSDAFMEAIKDDAEWLLYFKIPPIDQAAELAEMNFQDDAGNMQYVYSVWQARELWQLIMKSTYEYSEPGVIFIDRVNDLNNLWYCEDIQCTNPCGEQPLPPHNACDLGHNNLARMVREPFKSTAYFDFDLLARVTKAGVRFLDNIWDVTNYPLPEQEAEGKNKRRTGLGYTGLADVFAQLSIRYGSAKSIELTDRIGQVMAIAAYEASIELAKEKGAFPAFDAEQYLSGDSFVNLRMPQHIHDGITAHGIRNSVLLTIAPTGTSSIVFGNASGGLEPFFSLLTERKVLQPDGTHKHYVEGPYAAKLYKHLQTIEVKDADTTNVNPGLAIDLPPFFTTMSELSVHEHINIQAAAQRWVDASISKTINLPKDMEYEDFVQVYDIAYAAGCKGCTTYRPSDVRGSVLEDVTAKKSTAISMESVPPSTTLVQERPLRKRPEILHGTTYKIKWPRRSSSLYLTINSDTDGVPFEVLIHGKDGSQSEWTTALSLMITAIMRKGGDIGFIGEELRQIQSISDGAFIDKQHFGSLPAYIGSIIDRHITNAIPKAEVTISETDVMISETLLPKCPECHAPTLRREQGCDKCGNCGYSKCS